MFQMYTSRQILITVLPTAVELLKNKIPHTL